MSTKRKPLTPAQREAKNAAARKARAAASKPPVKKPAAKPAVKPPVKGKAKPAIKPAKIAQNGYTRPKPLNMAGKPKLTARVWQIADEISAKARKMATRAEVLAQCTKEKIKYSTFSNQFYRWRKFNGKFGRIRKDGKPAKPMPPRSGKRGKPRKPGIGARNAVAQQKKANKPAVKPAAAPVKPAIKPPVAAPAKPALPFPVPAAPAK